MCLMLNGKACTTAWAGPKCNKALTGGRNRAVTGTTEVSAGLQFCRDGRR